MMDCKKALTEANGDFEAAIDVLRKQGQKVAAKRADRDATEGAVIALTNADQTRGVVISLNCETDFVAKNANFRDFVEAIIDHIAASESVDSVDALQAQALSHDPSQTLEVFIKAKVGQLGEKMGLGRFAKYELGGEGTIGSYIHMQGRVGVLV